MGKIRSAGVVTASPFTDPVVFQDDFESGGLAAWDSQSTTGLGSLSVTPEAALNGSGYGLEAGTSASSSTAYVRKDFSDMTEIHIRAYFQSVLLRSGPGATMLRGFMNKPGSSQLFFSIAHGINGFTISTPGAASVTVTAPSNPVRIEVEYRAVASEHVFFRAWLNDVMVVERSGVDFTGYNFTSMLAGIIITVGGTWRIYLDDVKVKAQTFIGA